MANNKTNPSTMESAIDDPSSSSPALFSGRHAAEIRQELLKRIDQSKLEVFVRPSTGRSKVVLRRKIN